jgi:hypothetical protein
VVKLEVQVRFNLVAYWKRKYRNKQEDEPWYLLTNLPDLKSAIEVYSKRYGAGAKLCNSGIKKTSHIFMMLGIAIMLSNLPLVY